MNNIDFIKELKLRASWGISGNDRIGNYIFAQFYNSNLDYILGNDDNTVVGAGITNLANPTIQWEETEQYDIGLNMGLFNNKIEIIADYFNKNSTNILYTNFPIPNTIGVETLAAQNAASINNKGLELGVYYRTNIGKAKLDIGANMTRFLNNEVVGLGEGGEETITSTSIIRIGEPLRSYFGYRAIGIFQTEEEVANSPVQLGNNNTAPGDLKYADISGPEGIPDGVIDANDRTIIGNPNPDLLYNFNFALEYSNFDLNFLFQGVNGIDRIFMENGNLPMEDDRSNVLSYWMNRWTPENPSNVLPRIGGVNNGLVSSFYVQDASYLRLKNLEIGYSIPDNVINSLGISKFRVYAGAQNLLTFSDLDNFDPEGTSARSGNRQVPLYKTITLGVNVKL